MYLPSWFSIFYTTLTSLVVWNLMDEKQAIAMAWGDVALMAGIIFALWLVAFILQGIGLYKMAKKQNIKQAFLAFVPFAKIYLVGKIAGEISFFGHRVQRLGFYAMLLEIVLSIFYIFMSVAMCILYVENGDKLSLVGELPQWSNLSSSALAWKQFWDVAQQIMSITGLIHAIIILMLYLGFYKRYVYRNNMLLVLGGVFLPFFNEIATFAIRNRNQIDWESVKRARQEEFRRRQQQGGQYGPYGGPYGGPFGGPYGNPYGNPYGGNPYGQSSTPPKEKKPEDPFGEFSEKTNADDDPFL